MLLFTSNSFLEVRVNYLFLFKEKKSQLNEKVKNVENDNNLSQANVFDNQNYSISPKKVNNKNVIKRIRFKNKI